MSKAASRLMALLLAAPFAATGCGAHAPLDHGGQSAAVQLAQAEPRGTAQRQVPADAAPAGNARAADTRQVIYSAEVSLVTADFDRCESELPAVVGAERGFIAQADVDRTAGSSRTGRWTLRVPADRYQPLVDALHGLGYLETCRQTAADVTAECLDLDARLANGRKLESSIARLLETRSGDIKDVIAVEQELGRVRGDIERMEARRRWLSDQTAWSTITLSVREQKAFTPPAAPTLAGRLAAAWSNSTADIVQVVQAALVVVAAVTPWLLTGLPVLACAGLARLARLRRLRLAVRAKAV